MLDRARQGSWITATGGNERAAIARGVNTANLKIGLFVLSAVLAALAGLISSWRIDTVYAISGTGYELEVIAMCVVGGTSLYGGRGTIIGTVIGVILLRSIRNGIIVIGVPGLAYNMFVGLIILVALAFLLRRDLSTARAQVLFHYSLAYLALLFVAAAIDPLVT